MSGSITSFRRLGNTHRHTVLSVLAISMACGTILSGATAASLETDAPTNASAARPAAGPIVAELFLSQSCNRCPPAAALFPKLAARDDVIALSWHVDYWNTTATTNGRWHDPFSKTAFSKRQKRYNANIRKRSSTYTPQIIINGTAQTIGSDETKISALLDKTPARPSATITAKRLDDTLTFSIGNSPDGGNAYLVTFTPETSTTVTAGANVGNVFRGVNVVTNGARLGLVSKAGGGLTTPPPAPGQGCALIVQAPGQAEIIAAAYCPA